MVWGIYIFFRFLYLPVPAPSTVSDLHPGNADAILNFKMPSFEGFGLEYGDSAKADPPHTGRFRP